jgi:Cdc6-like AAA superfamily ATPase
MPTPGDFEHTSFMLSTVFKPTAPISQESLFAGRQSQIRDVIDTINQQGQHAVLYGERGVGKTSLANMIFPKIHAPDSQVIVSQINCMTQDTFSDIWKRAFEETAFNATRDDRDIGKAGRVLKDYTKAHSDVVSPDLVRRVLYQLGQNAIVIVVLDEFDTVADEETRATMSDTLKFLSDRSVPATVILIGVSDDVETLVKNHRSLERCLRQIQMPRMSDDELATIITHGLYSVQMQIDPSALDEIVRLSRGLPHYGHLLGLHSARAALDHKTMSVSEIHVQLAINDAISKTQASIRSDYSKATTTSRREALYKEVLLACALADTDDLGWFYPRNVRAPLEKILGRQYKIEAFSRHLAAFCTDTHGSILVKDDTSARPRYRFENPLVQPYVLIRGLAERLILPADLHRSERNPKQGELFQ